ncbi:pancreatic hormone-like protein [Coleophoma cylindrospora]|uniref:Pancreatic hormone-like protein n=1 Tax=Coleophoma cylindrospora TaxID=1849047 RepID=A0A3D8QSH7_9HELO|nr:pancreatic hormone-like protein [Coleophoma cylindrospora]
MKGTYEYSDFPMDEARFGVRSGQHIPGAVTHRYLTEYTQHFGFFDKIRFNTKVLTAEKFDRGWKLTIANRDDGQDGVNVEASQILTSKMIIATGLTSEARLPNIPGSESFGCPLFHSREFLDYAYTINTTNSVTVLGGAKSAWDAAYAYASAGVPVDMIIRKSGRGPVWMAPPYVTPLKKWLEKLVHTRFLTWFSPCIWGFADGYPGIRKFLHGTSLGRTIVNKFWSILGNDVLTLNAYDKHPEVKKLKPWQDAFWIGSGLSILNFPTDFFQLVKDGKIRVHIADITHLSEKTVHLSNGERLKTDALLCATGWKAGTPIKFVNSGTNEELGLPYYSDKLMSLVSKADTEILKQFPRLKDQPSINKSTSKATTPNQSFKLYRFMVPPSMVDDKTIAFAGMVTTITTSMCAQLQGLWISVYFDGKLDRLPESKEGLYWETTLHSRFGKWRYPSGHGAMLPDFVFDAMPYIDLLMADLGLHVHRKSGALAEIFQPYGPEDYQGLVMEWKKNHIAKEA